METLVYEDLVEHFQSSLLTTLRAHSAASDLLELWVPDPDPISSIVNMVDSCDFENIAGFMLRVSLKTLLEEQLKSIVDILKEEVHIYYVQEEETYLLTVSPL